MNKKTALEEYCDIGVNIFQSENWARLEPRNCSESIEEGLQARIKDPLWLLGRQWQSGEFQGQNGGIPVRVEVTYCNEEIDKIKSGRNYEKFPLNAPLEMIAEKEGKGRFKNYYDPIPSEIGDGKESFNCENWDSTHLEYNFKLKGDNTELTANEYDGSYLDWYNFDLSEFKTLKNNTKNIAAFPTKVSFYGMPNARWWAFEDQKINLANVQNETLNYLMMTMTEFSLIYSNDWFNIPIDYEVGNLCQIKDFRVIDSFGVVSTIKPAINNKNKDWSLFSLHSNSFNDGSIFYMPNNVAKGALESEPLEEISLIRDEIANLVWAVERSYQKEYTKSSVFGENDKIIDTLYEDEIIDRENETLRPPEFPIMYWDTKNKELVEEDKIDGSSRYEGPLDKFNLMSYVPPYWIPYQARKINSKDKYDEQIILRRSRTQLNVENETQYKGVIVRESKFIAEEEVPRTGTLIQRVWQLVRDENKNLFLWRSRKKRPDSKRRSSNLQFDYLSKRREE